MIAVVGLGFVGSALWKSFEHKKVTPLFVFDKFKNGGIGSLEECLQSRILFICLPTPYNEDTKEYGKEAINETMERLAACDYAGVVVIKSTVEPGTTEDFSRRYPKLSILHNPEFLSAATAFHDFHNQKHIVLGAGSNCSEDQVQGVYDFYHTFYPEAEISLCGSNESESMKSFVNCFYALKIQFFNELFLLCQSNGTDFNTVRDLMLKNKWINPMHTSVPGRDGKLSYGGGCFPKDTNALLQHMKRAGTPHAVLEGCISERNVMRGEVVKDHKQNKLTNGHTEHTIKLTNGIPDTDINQNGLKLIKHICGHVENGHTPKQHPQCACE